MSPRGGLCADEPLHVGDDVEGAASRTGQDVEGLEGGQGEEEVDRFVEIRRLGATIALSEPVQEAPG